MNESTSTDAAMPNRLGALLDWYAGLRRETLGELAQLYTPDARFRDPFNAVRGHADIHHVFAHMFDTTEDPRFVIVSRAQEGRAAFVTWRFHFRLRGRPYEVEGASHLLFAGDGCVQDHRDYWDAAEELFQKLPVVGPPVRWLRGRFRTPGIAEMTHTPDPIHP